MSERSEKRRRPRGRPGRRTALAPLSAALLSAVLGTVVASVVQAQPAPPTLRRPIERTSGNYRAQGEKPWWISRRDCLDDERFKFPIGGLTGNLPLEVWVGTEDCAARRGDERDRGQCWIVARISQPDAVNQIVEVPTRRVVARRLGTTQPPGGDDEPGPEVCKSDDDPNGTQLTYYFLLEDGGQAVAQATWSPTDSGGTGFDLTGPAPPGSISVGIGDRQLSIRLRDVGEVSDRNRFEAYCVPAGTGVGGDAGMTSSTPGEAGDAGDAGAVADAGPAGLVVPLADRAPSDCYTPLVYRGGPAPDGYSCGSASETTGTLTTGRLDNAINYAVGVVGTDLLGNAGVLSNVECGRPRQLDDFYELYARAGGAGGGGFCSLRPPGRNRSQASLGVLLALGCVLAGRRQGRRAS